MSPALSPTTQDEVRSRPSRPRTETMPAPGFRSALARMTHRPVGHAGRTTTGRYCPAAPSPIGVLVHLVDVLKSRSSLSLAGAVRHDRYGIFFARFGAAIASIPVRNSSIYQAGTLPMVSN